MKMKISGLDQRRSQNLNYHTNATLTRRHKRRLRKKRKIEIPAAEYKSNDDEIVDSSKVSQTISFSIIPSKSTTTNKFDCNHPTILFSNCSSLTFPIGRTPELDRSPIVYSPSADINICTIASRQPISEKLTKRKRKDENEDEDDKENVENT